MYSITDPNIEDDLRRVKDLTNDERFETTVDNIVNNPEGVEYSNIDIPELIQNHNLACLTSL